MHCENVMLPPPREFTVWARSISKRRPGSHRDAVCKLQTMGESEMRGVWVSCVWWCMVGQALTEYCRTTAAAAPARPLREPTGSRELRIHRCTYSHALRSNAAYFEGET